MSLLKHLLLSVTVAILAILVGTLAFSIDSARDYMNVQVQSESENAASALAITLSQPANQDPVIRELLLMALYDTGRIQAIRYTEPDGKVVFERSHEASAQALAVPGWFRSLLPLETPTAVRDVSDGWRQAGQLTIVGNNGYAYASLWENALRQSTLVLVAGLLWALVVIVLMRWLRRALNKHVAAQVRAIAESDEAPPAAHTAMRELNTLVSEISQVRERVRANVYEMDAKIESLNLELNQDAVTGLANRKYFVNEMRRLLHDEATAPGHVMLARVRDLAAVSAAHSRQDVDAWLRRAAQTMRDVAGAENADAQVARLNGSDFAILIPGLDGPEAIRFARTIGARVRELRLSLPDGGYSRWAFSLTDYASGREVGSVMGLLDNGLMRAESAGQVEAEYLPGERSTTSRMEASEGDWRTLLREALDEDGLRLQVTDATYDEAEPLLYGDGSLQLRDGQDWLSGALFMPVAVRLNVSVECDLRAIDLGIEWIKANRRDLALRISLATLMQLRFWPELRLRLDALARQPDIARHLVFELDAHGLVACLEPLRQLAEAAREAGVRVGVRRLDAEPAALTKLHETAIDYLRLTGSLIDGLSEGVGARELLRAIVTTARSLNLKVVADAPANDADREVLREHGVLVAVRG